MKLQKAIQHFDSFGKSFTLDEARADVHLLISNIYNDFESRKCEDCEHFIKSSVSCFIMPIDIQILPNGFSCNKWEKK